MKLEEDLIRGEVKAVLIIAPVVPIGERDFTVTIRKEFHRKGEAVERIVSEVNVVIEPVVAPLEVETTGREPADLMESGEAGPVAEGELFHRGELPAEGLMDAQLAEVDQRELTGEDVKIGPPLEAIGEPVGGRIRLERGRELWSPVVDEGDPTMPDMVSPAR